MQKTFDESGRRETRNSIRWIVGYVIFQLVTQRLLLAPIVGNAGFIMGLVHIIAQGCGLWGVIASCLSSKGSDDVNYFAVWATIATIVTGLGTALWLVWADLNLGLVVALSLVIGFGTSAASYLLIENRNRKI